MTVKVVAARGIDWRGVDGQGFYYGFYRDGLTQYQVDIAVPGKGLKPHRGPDYKVYVAGEKVGSMPTLKGAAAFADLWFTEGRHRPHTNGQSRAQTQSSTQASAPQARPGQPQQQGSQTAGRNTVESEIRERRSLYDVLEAYLGKKPPTGRSR